MTSAFFSQVRHVVRLIPPGRVATYGQIARLLGQPRAARTVGWALHSTPDGEEIPWQRVINSRGTISFGARSPGADLQQALLEAEGVVFDEQGRVDLKVYGWAGLGPAELRQVMGAAIDIESTG